MGVFTDSLKEEVRLERMRPEQIEAAMAKRAAIYVPFGAIEWHGIQNAVGLDAIKAHEQLVGLAARAGGVVYPPVFFGSGGGHIGWPHTYMVGKTPMTQIVQELLHDFEKDGFENAILLSGHYPNKFEFQDAAAKAYHDAGGKMRILSIIENRVPGVEGDHAAKQETSFMLYLHPETVNMKLLERRHGEFQGGPEESINFMEDKFKGLPCYGLVGIDPLHASASHGKISTEKLIAFLEDWLNNKTN